MQSRIWIFTFKVFVTVSSAHAENLWYDVSKSDLLNLDTSIFDGNLLDFNEPNVDILDEPAANLPENPDWTSGASVNVGDRTNLASLDTMTPGLLGTDLRDSVWTNSISAGDGFEAASSTCSASSHGLGRRGLSVCPAKRPDLEYELRFVTTDERFFFMSGNLAVCRMFEMCPGCLFAVCDSGVEADRIPTLKPEIYDLNNVSPCNAGCYLSDALFLIFRVVDLAKGCFSPHDIWCCGNPFFGDYEDHNLLSYVSWLVTLAFNSG